VRAGVAIVSSGAVSGASQGAKRRDCFAERNQTLRDEGRKSLKSLGAKSRRFGEPCLFNSLTVISFRACPREPLLSIPSSPRLTGRRTPRSQPHGRCWDNSEDIREMARCKGKSESWWRRRRTPRARHRSRAAGTRIGPISSGEQSGPALPIGAGGDPSRLRAGALEHCKGAGVWPKRNLRSVRRTSCLAGRSPSLSLP
jgi:hypothetical protein